MTHKLQFILLEERVVLDGSAVHVIFVNAHAAAGGNGSSWAHAYNNLDSALTAAANTPGSDQIWVAKGSYSPGSSPTDTFNLPNNVSIYGGFNGTESSLNQRNISANPTILEGNNITDTIVTVNGVTATLNGLTIQDANNTVGSGGGISETNGANLTITNDTFVNNRTPTNDWTQVGTVVTINVLGGAIYDSNSTLTVTSSSFLNNQSTEGGAIGAVGNVSVSISSSNFLNNNQYEGAVAGLGSKSFDLANLSPVAGNLNISSSNFQNNTSVEGGGAIFESQNLTLSVSSSIFNSNTGIYGGGIESEGSKLFQVTGDIFTSNFAYGGYGGAISDAFNLKDVISASIFANNSAGNPSQSDNGGGALDLEPGDGTILIDGCVFTNNTVYGAGSVGGVIDTPGDSSVSFIGNVFVGNSAPGAGSQGGAIWDSGSTTYTILGNVFAGNTAAAGNDVALSGETTVNGIPFAESSAVINSLVSSNAGLFSNDILLF